MSKHGLASVALSAVWSSDASTSASLLSGSVKPGPGPEVQAISHALRATVQALTLRDTAHTCLAAGGLIRGMPAVYQVLSGRALSSFGRGRASSGHMRKTALPRGLRRRLVLNPAQLVIRPDGVVGLRRFTVGKPPGAIHSETPLRRHAFPHGPELSIGHNRH